MKVLGFAAIVTVALFTAIGCSDKTPAPQAKECVRDGETAPQWVCAPYFDEKHIAGLGYAKKNKGGDYSFQLKQAQGDGRTDIANTMSVSVRAALDSWKRNTGVGDDAVFEQNVEAVSRQTAFQNIAGSRPQYTWQHPSNGDLYVLMIAPVDQAEQAMMTSLQNKNALWQQFQSAQAQEKLKEEFEKHLATQNGGM
ncbi:MAG: LPP20 family lipoprotein [Helicobacteraceae bacterium]|nr:LPP20 family lipoprotein [Helicobacteraceae bacterium]